MKNKTLTLFLLKKPDLKMTRYPMKMQQSKTKNPPTVPIMMISSRGNTGDEMEDTANEFQVFTIE